MDTQFAAERRADELIRSAMLSLTRALMVTDEAHDAVEWRKDAKATLAGLRAHFGMEAE